MRNSLGGRVFRGEGGRGGGDGGGGKELLPPAAGVEVFAEDAAPPSTASQARAGRLKPLVRWTVEGSYDDLRARENEPHGAKNKWKLKIMKAFGVGSPSFGKQWKENITEVL